MRTLLRIDASVRTNGSHSRQLADYYQSLWENAHPQNRIIRRDLACVPLPHLSNEMIAAFRDVHESPTEATALSDTLIAELYAANDLLISNPLYNLTLPSTLKAYFDHVVRTGRTITLRDGRYIGLLAGRTATLITVRGGISRLEMNDDFQTPYLIRILAFLGITAISNIFLEGTSMDETTRSKRLIDGLNQLDQIFLPVDDENGAEAGLTAEDIRQITALCDGQAMAICTGNASRYADLCTDDVLLMLPGRDIVQGRTQFLATEEEIFRGTAFADFHKTPVMRKRNGDVVIEVGRQEVRSGRATEGGIFASQQKYLHVYRHTPAGWRYAILMSNATQ